MASIYTHNGTWTLKHSNHSPRSHIIFRVKTSTTRTARSYGRRILSKKIGARFVGIGYVNEADVWLFPRVTHRADVDLLISLSAMTEAQLEELGYDDGEGHWTITAATLCRRCNRMLTTPESIRTGIGPVCANQPQRELPDATRRANIIQPVQQEERQYQRQQGQYQRQNNNGNALTAIEGEVLRETERAVLFKTDRGNQWLPKSKIEVDDTDTVLVVSLPQWLADKYNGQSIPFNTRGRRSYNQQYYRGEN